MAVRSKVLEVAWCPISLDRSSVSCAITVTELAIALHVPSRTSLIITSCSDVSWRLNHVPASHERDV